MMPGVISPGRLLDVDVEMLKSELKWRSCCSVLVDLQQIIRCWIGACTTKECITNKTFSLRGSEAFQWLLRTQWHGERSDCELLGCLLCSAPLVLRKESRIILSRYPEGSALYHSQIFHIKQLKQYIQLQVDNQRQQIAMPCHAHFKYLIFLYGYLIYAD